MINEFHYHLSWKFYLLNIVGKLYPNITKAQRAQGYWYNNKHIIQIKFADGIFSLRKTDKLEWFSIVDALNSWLY